MNKVWVITRREYSANVRTKAFAISVVLMPIMMGGAILAQYFLRGRVDLTDKVIVVVDATGKMLPGLMKAADQFNTTEIYEGQPRKQVKSRIVLKEGPAWPLNDEHQINLSDDVRKSRVAAFAVIPPSLLTDTDSEGVETPRFYSQGIGSDRLRNWFESELSQLVRSERMAAANLDPAVVARVSAPVYVKSMGLSTRDSGGKVKDAKASSRAVTIFAPMAVMMLMFMSMMMAQQLLTTALEEKQQRIAEVLLGSISPFELMLGKLIGNVGVALTVTSIYLAGAYAMMEYYDYTGIIPLGLMIWILAYQAIGLFIFGSVYLAIGAAVTDFKEAQSLMTPVILILIFPMLIWFIILENPLSKFAVILSLLPPAAPMLMPMRMAASQGVPLWQPIAGMASVLIGALICVFAAGRVFRIGLLSQGKAPKFSELVRWAITG